MTTINDLPKPGTAQLTRSQTLTDWLKERIRTLGPISYADYMDAALYHPELGYYNAVEFNLGKKGDFTTAPETSPLFAACLAKQSEQVLRLIDTGDILELGAGSGRLAHDLLLELEKLNSLPAHYYILEISLSLREKQKQLLQAECPHLAKRVTWLDKPPANFKGVMIANEVLDALPIHRFQITETGIAEQCVDFADEQFCFINKELTNPQLAKHAINLQEQYQLPPGYTSEINLNALNLTEELSHSLRLGLILLIDYGYGQLEYYHPARDQGTLTCFYQHHHHNQPFYYPGLQDLTAHVDFTNIIDKAIDSGCDLAGYTSQAAFLLGCGLMDAVQIAEEGLSPADLFDLHQAVKILTMPTEMGDIIKVMGLSKGLDAALLGFQLQDRRRDL